MKAFKLLLILLLPLLFPGSGAAQVAKTPFSINGARLDAEIAHTDAARRQGLMHRKQMPENHGMFFIFPVSDYHAMWMRHTFIPLSVAFLDEEGVIINIVDMVPHSEVLHGPTRPAKYVLEMNLGWFAKHGIKPGNRLQTKAILPRAE